MGQYKKANSRLKVSFYDSDTNELLFEINDRDHSDIGIFFTDHYADQIMRSELGDDSPDNFTVLVSGEFNLT